MFITAGAALVPAALLFYALAELAFLMSQRIVLSMVAWNRPEKLRRRTERARFTRGCAAQSLVDKDRQQITGIRKNLRESKLRLRWTGAEHPR